MLWLIDGYNLMHAAGAVDSSAPSRKVFARKRRRFLIDLADALGQERCRETTVVLDANSPPADFPLESDYQGLHLIFALGDESADARIETLIAAHSAPKSLTVVSSDRRVRRAASRRRARALSADEFLDLLDRFKFDRKAPPVNPLPSAQADVALTPEERAYWLEQFAGVDASPEAREGPANPPVLLTDADIARIQQEIDSEA